MKDARGQDILHRLSPVSRVFGLDRGKPIDRHYIEAFLEAASSAISGRVLEIGDDAYTRRYGGGRVMQSDVLHAAAGNRKATIVGDLATGDGIPVGAFDCFICTQTLQFVADVPAAVRTIERILRPGGTVLATVPGITQISRYDMDRWGEYWRFTTLSARRLFEAAFPPKNVEVRAFGNVFVACAFLRGLAVEELPTDDLGVCDPDYELVITIQARKSEASA